MYGAAHGIAFDDELYYGLVRCFMTSVLPTHSTVTEWLSR